MIDANAMPLAVQAKKMPVKFHRHVTSSLYLIPQQQPQFTF